jgi:hypothetical protein
LNHKEFSVGFTELLMLYQQQNYTTQATVWRQDEVKFQIIKKYLKQTSDILYYFGIDMPE